VVHAYSSKQLKSGSDHSTQVAPTLRAPLILFTYYNPILRRGLEPFISEIAAAGVGGLLIPDIPLEETTEARALCARYKLELVLLATPTTQSSRMARIAEATAGFVYLVSVTGVTGVQDKLQDRVERLVAQLKAVTNKPVAVGFGVSKPEQAAQLAAWGADGVIVGSALVRALGEAPTPGALHPFTSTLALRS
jgi:tryptophan synthase alpha chain